MVHDFDDKLEKLLDEEYGWNASHKLMEEDYDYYADKYRDQIEDMYTECEHCKEEFTDHELQGHEVGGVYFKHICDDCLQQYNEQMELYVDDARQRCDQDWIDGVI